MDIIIKNISNISQNLVTITCGKPEGIIIGFPGEGGFLLKNGDTCQVKKQILESLKKFYTIRDVGSD